MLAREERRDVVRRLRRVRPGGVVQAVRYGIDPLPSTHGLSREAELYDWFDRVVVINLDRRPDRWERVQRHLAEVGWPFRYPQRVSAIDGKQDKRPGWWRAGAPAWGCYRSHLGVIEDALNDGIESLLVLEDDVLLPETFRARVAEFLNQLPKDWHGLYLGGQHIRPGKQPPENLGNGVLQAKNVNRLHAYAMRGDYLHAVRDHLQDLDAHAQQHRREGAQGQEKAHHVDHRMGVLHETGKWNIYCPEQWIAGQAEGRSDICAKTLKDRFWQHHPRKPRKSHNPLAAVETARTPPLVPTRQSSEIGKLLITAHPRSGTKYLSKLCQAYGLDVGHERMGANGICSWMLAADADCAPYGDGTTFQPNVYDRVIRLVRHPLRVLASVIHTENIEPDQPVGFGKHSCREYVRRHAFGERSWALRRYVVRAEGNRYEQAVQTLLVWDTLIDDRKPAFTVHAEAAAEELPRRLGLNPLEASRLPSTKVHARKHPELTWVELKRHLRAELVTRLEDYTRRYGYDLESTASPYRQAVVKTEQQSKTTICQPQSRAAMMDEGVTV